MQLYFIRHGQSTNNALWEDTGTSQGRQSDPDLSEIGKQQIHHLANYLKLPRQKSNNDKHDLQNRWGFPISHIYTSLMIRAIKTGAVISEALTLPMVAWEDIHELGGIYLTDETTGTPKGLPGNSREYFETHFPALILPQEITADGWWSRPHEPEDLRPVRAQRFLDRLINLHASQDDGVVVISHAGFYDLFMKTLLSMPLDEKRWFIINNTGITRIDITPEWSSVVYQNRVSHLPCELIT